MVLTCFLKRVQDQLRKLRSAAEFVGIQLRNSPFPDPNKDYVVRSTVMRKSAAAFALTASLLSPASTSQQSPEHLRILCVIKGAGGSVVLSI